MLRSRQTTALLATCLGVVGSLTILEVFLRIFPPAAPVIAQAVLAPDRGLFCQYDPLLGYDGVPNLTALWPKGSAISLNSNGNRDRDHSSRRSPDAARVIFLGDSFVWGYDVGDHERVSDRLPDFFMAEGTGFKSVEPINLAVSGYGTDQEALKYWTKGRHLDPDLVVLGFFSGNDALENTASEYWKCPKPRFVLREGKLVLTGVPVSRIEGWSNNKIVSPHGRLLRWLPGSSLIRTLSEREFPVRWLPRSVSRELKELASIGATDDVNSTADQVPSDAITITRAIADRLNAHLISQRIPLVLLLIPSAHLYVGDKPQEAAFYDGMREWAEARQVPYIDYLALTSEFRSHFSDLYFGLDEHWTPFGHEMAARFLAQRIEKILAAKGSRRP